MMELQRFVTSVIEAMGGIVQPTEYALCSVLIPDEYSSIFQGRTELTLSFDYEVAQENSESEFITLGSYILEQIISFAGSRAVSIIRYVIVDQLTLNNAVEKIKKFLNANREQVEILSAKEVLGSYVEFNYKVGYTSEERIEESREVWINMQTGKNDIKIKKNKSKIFYSSDNTNNYPLSLNKNIMEAFEQAYNVVKEEATSNSSIRVNKLELNREMHRITQYYQELLAENSKKMSRKGISTEKINELSLKSEALNLEKERQLNEMMFKYTVKIDVSLEYGILYFIPLIEYKVKIVSKGTVNEIVLYYNPVLKDFDMQ